MPSSFENKKRLRFVITLDGDTRLPRDVAKRLVGKLAHRALPRRHHGFDRDHHAGQKFFPFSGTTGVHDVGID